MKTLNRRLNTNNEQCSLRYLRNCLAASILNHAWSIFVIFPLHCFFLSNLKKTRAVCLISNLKETGEICLINKNVFPAIIECLSDADGITEKKVFQSRIFRWMCDHWTNCFVFISFGTHEHNYIEFLGFFLFLSASYWYWRSKLNVWHLSVFCLSLWSKGPFLLKFPR